MLNWDLIIYENSNKREIVNRFRITDEKMRIEGQHGHSIILKDEKGQSWLLKIFKNIIDFELKEVFNLDVDINDTPEKSRDRMHLWRIMNELVASRFAQRLKLNVPEVFIVCSQKISDYKLEQETLLKLGDVIIIDAEEGAPETAEEYYGIKSRAPYIQDTSEKFENLLKMMSREKDPSTIIALLIKRIPNSINLDQYIDSFDEDHERAFNIIRYLNDGYCLIPFDIWLNDPDRNAGNYLVELNEKNEAKKVWGIDYEMWSLGSDQIEDEIAMGRSYLAAIIHSVTNIFDERILKTLYRIRSLSDDEIISFTRAPQILCKYFEYHISENNIDPEERIILRQIEANLEDFLLESRPRSDKLSEILLKQIGLPKDFKP